MIDLPQSLQKAVEGLTRLPGVGSKSALRYILSMLRWSHEERMHLTHALTELSDLRFCDDCGFFSEQSPCKICASQKRQESGLLCVIESVSDLMAIERGESYNGHHHILGGVLNPLSGIGPQDLRIAKLVERVDRGDYQEVILAINPSVEGDATCAYLGDLLKNKVSVQRIGFGIPIGGSLEYLDSMTITKALENKRLL